MESSIKTVAIRPGISILSVLQSLNYKPWFALAEFVDNSLQSYLANREELEAIHGVGFALKVEIEVSSEKGGYIVIRDNAAGIKVSDFERAFKAAEVPPNRTGLSEFGMGMKSAAFWFADWWSVKTKAISENVERSVVFDIHEITSQDLNELVVIENSGDIANHFTEITLKKIAKLPQTKTLRKIRDHLTSIYRTFLRKGHLRLFFNGDELQHEEPEVLYAPYYKDRPDSHPYRWYKPIDFQIGATKRVTGFAALRNEGSTKLAGFSLFRRDRLIQGSSDETYRPQKIFGNPNSYRYQRLFGELHIEGLKVSHTKDGFRWDEYEEEFLEQLRLQLEATPLNLLTQAEGYRARLARHASDMHQTDSRSNVQHAETNSGANLAVPQKNDVIEALPNHNSQLSDRFTELPSSVAAPHSSGAEDDLHTMQVSFGGDDWVVTLRTVEDGGTGKWIRVLEPPTNDDTDPSTRPLCIEISLSHPLSKGFMRVSEDNKDLLIRLSMGIVLAQKVASQLPTQDGFHTPLHFLNQLVTELLSTRLLGGNSADL